MKKIIAILADSVTAGSHLRRNWLEKALKKPGAFAVCRHHTEHGTESGSTRLNR